MPEATMFVGPLDRVLYFRTLPAFEQLPAAALAAIAQQAREEFFPRETLLFRAGEPADAIFLVVDGEVAVHRPQRAAQHLGPGEAVGFLELLARSGNDLEARATQDTLALKLDWEAQVDLLEEHFALVVEFARYLALRIIQERNGRPPSSTPPAHETTLERPLDLVARIQTLSSSPSFPTGDLDALSELARHVTAKTWSPGDVLWQAGSRDRYFYVIVHGTAHCTMANGAGPPIPRHGPNVLGMHSALAALPRQYAAHVADELDTLRIDVEPFFDILEDHFDLATDFLALMAQELIDLLDHRKT